MFYRVKVTIIGILEFICFFLFFLDVLYFNGNVKLIEVDLDKGWLREGALLTRDFGCRWKGALGHDSTVILLLSFLELFFFMFRL